MGPGLIYRTRELGTSLPPLLLVVWSPKSQRSRTLRRSRNVLNRFLIFCSSFKLWNHIALLETRESPPLDLHKSIGFSYRKYSAEAALGLFGRLGGLKSIIYNLQAIGKHTRTLVSDLKKQAESNSRKFPSDWERFSIEILRKMRKSSKLPTSSEKLPTSISATPD